jgi:hypothetical protein
MRKLVSDNQEEPVRLCDIALAALELDRTDGPDLTVQDVIDHARERATTRHARSQ